MRPPDQRGGRPWCPPRPSPEAKTLLKRTLSRPQHPVEEIFPEIFPRPATARDQVIARLARLLAEDGDTTLAARITAVQVLHRIRHGGTATARESWQLRCIAGRQRQAARRWLP